MKQDLYALAERLQTALLRVVADHPADWGQHIPRVQLDAWATLSRWHAGGERVWRISAAMAEETEDMALPSALDLATARTRGEAVAYQLPLRSEWIVVARHTSAPCEVIVRSSVRPIITLAVFALCCAVLASTL